MKRKYEVVIRRKYKVFISSTFMDLEDARERLIREVLRLKHIPAGMELLIPGTENNLDVIKREISTSDIFVVLVGNRLGSLVQEKRKKPVNFVSKEYDLAVEYGLPIVAFLLDNDKPDKEMEPLLKQFREKVVRRAKGGERIAGTFSKDNVDQLCLTFSLAIREESDRLDVDPIDKGWVPGRLYDHFNERVYLGQTSAGNVFFEEFAERLNSFDKLSRRCTIAAPAKEKIAQYFWKQYLPLVDEKGITHIYFGSGSSIAYVTREFISYIRSQEWPYENKLDERLHLRTNNILTYLQFLLVKSGWSPMDIQLMPHGSFSSDYGATYGRLRAIRTITAPSSESDSWKLPPKAHIQMQNLPIERDKFSKSGLVLMSTSGIDIRPDSPFPGPHVGSPYNMLLKRCLISLKCPKVMFLDMNKWGYDFQMNRCYPICDADLSWDQVKSETPLAIAIATDSKTQCDETRASLKRNGFPHQEVPNPDLRDQTIWPIIAKNDLFCEYFKESKAVDK